MSTHLILHWTWTVIWAVIVMSSGPVHPVLALEEQDDVVGVVVGSSSSPTTAVVTNETMRERYEALLAQTVEHSSTDDAPDGMLLPFARDSDCDEGNCYAPPDSTIETTRVQQQVCQDGNENEDVCVVEEMEVDKHWGSDRRILSMRDKLRKLGSGIYHTNEDDTSNHDEHHPFDANVRPPIFLMPGLAATRLVAWKHKTCPHSPLLSDIKFHDYVWLNMKLLVQMGTIAGTCWEECMTLGRNQTDSDIGDQGCKLRPDEGLDAIASLAPGSVGAELLVGETNTLFAWLVQWLADNLGYDLSNIIGLPYDWRLSPHMMEKRDGFLSHTRRRIEAAVKANGGIPGIMVAHSMGNSVFRYFLLWLRQEMRDEAFQRITSRAERRARRQKQQEKQQEFLNQGGWLSGVTNGFDELWNTYFGEEVGDNKPKPRETPRRESEATQQEWQFWELAKHEGDEAYLKWMEAHIWTYVGLSAPLLGAVNPLRSVISGENMGLPFTDEIARKLELSFGCTNTVNPISSKMAFCDSWAIGEDGDGKEAQPISDLYCLDALVREIEDHTHEDDPWASFPQLKTLLKDRVDWESDMPMITIADEALCTLKEDAKACEVSIALNASQVQTGDLFRAFSQVWKEEHHQMDIKREQMEDSFWHTKVPNMLNMTWDRPYVKHVIMAYGVDLPTERGYEYRKRRKAKHENKNHKYDGPPVLSKVFWETPGGILEEQIIEASRGSLTDALIKKKPKLEPILNGTQLHSGDGTIPYLSLSWAHTWLLHAIRAQRFTYGKMEGNILDTVQVSHRPVDELEWKVGRPPEQWSVTKRKKTERDTGTSHPHGTKYKPQMVKFHNVGKSRQTGMEYSTTVIEAAGVEHKETTRNYDILAAAFSEILIHMHDDFGLV